MIKKIVVFSILLLSSLACSMFGGGQKTPTPLTSSDVTATPEFSITLDLGGPYIDLLPENVYNLRLVTSRKSECNADGFHDETRLKADFKNAVVAVVKNEDEEVVNVIIVQDPVFDADGSGELLTSHAGLNDGDEIEFKFIGPNIVGLLTIRNCDGLEYRLNIKDANS